MAKTMTFEEMLTANPNLYENTEMKNDEATQAIIYDWFRFRRVTSNKKFPLYFQRVIARDYSRYLQLLRIEAGKIGDTGAPTNYDWLVLDYLESIEDNDGQLSRNKVGNANAKLTPNTTRTVTHGGTDVSASHSNSSSDYNDNSDSVSAGSSQGHTSGSANAGQTTTAKAGSMARTTPMTQQYSQNQMNFGDDRRGIVVKTDDGYVVGEAENDQSYPSGEVKGSIRALYRNFPELNIQNPTSVSDSRTINGSISDSTNEGNSEENTSASSVSKSNGDSSTSQEGVSTTQYGQTITETRSGSGDVTNSDYADSELVDNNTQTRYMRKGRNGETAEILSNVIKFINKCSACDWYRSQLETCFIQCFDEEED